MKISFLFLFFIFFTFDLLASNVEGQKPKQDYSYQAKVIDAVEKKEGTTEFVKRARYYGKAANIAKHEWDEGKD